MKPEADRLFREGARALEVASEALRGFQQSLTAELEAAERLQNVATRLISSHGTAELYDQIVDTLVAVLHSDFASLQVFHPERGMNGELRLVGHRGFSEEAAKQWEWVRQDTRTPCGEALQRRQRVAVSDVRTSDFMAGTDCLESYIGTGIFAAQSTPLVSRSGGLLGMFSTHWREPHELSPTEIRTLNILARLAADLIERTQSEETLARESERRFRLLIESIPHLVWSYRTNGTLAYWNQRFADYTGLSEEELKQGGWSAVHTDDVPRLQQAWRNAWAHEAPLETECRLRSRDGSYRRFVCRGEPVPDSSGRMVEWFGTCTDVEDRRLAGEELHKAHLKLAHMTRLTTMGELAAAIAHEINQPLGAIVNNANVALRIADSEEGAGEELRGVLSDVIDDASRASAIIARLRQLVQRVTPSREPLQLSDLVHEVLALAQRELTERGVTVGLDIREDLPPVLGDRVQLQQVILNLVMNAAEAMSAVPGERRILTIAGTSWQRNGQLAALITVHDVGCGFGTGDPERLFEAFHTTKANGLGMGLRISHSIVEAHGGHLWAEANPGAGATFFVSLPGSIPVG